MAIWFKLLLKIPLPFWNFTLCFHGYVILCTALLVSIYIFFRAVICPMILCGRCELVGMGWLNGVAAAAASSQNPSSQIAPTQQISVLPGKESKDVVIPPVAQPKETRDPQRRLTGVNIDIQSEASSCSTPQEIKENDKNERRTSPREGEESTLPNPDTKSSDTADPLVLSPVPQTQLPEVFQPAHTRPYARPPSNDGSPLLRSPAQAIPMETLLPKEVLHSNGLNRYAYGDQRPRSPVPDPASLQSSAKVIQPDSLRTCVHSPSSIRNPPFQQLAHQTLDANTHSNAWEPSLPTPESAEVLNRTRTPHSAQPNVYLPLRIQNPLTRPYAQNPTSDVQAEVAESISDHAHLPSRNGSLTSLPPQN